MQLILPADALKKIDERATELGVERLSPVTRSDVIRLALQHYLGGCY